MSLYLECGPGKITLAECLSYEERAGIVLGMLIAGSPWVRLRSEDNEDWVSEWTVIERGPTGVVKQIGFRGFDGALEVIDNRETDGTAGQD